MNFASRNLLPSCPCVDVSCPIVQVLLMVRLSIAGRPESLSDPPAEEWDLVARGCIAQRCAHTQRYRGRPKGVVMTRQDVTALAHPECKSRLPRCPWTE